MHDRNIPIVCLQEYYVQRVFFSKWHKIIYTKIINQFSPPPKKNVHVVHFQNLSPGQDAGFIPQRKLSDSHAI